MACASPAKRARTASGRRSRQRLGKEAHRRRFQASVWKAQAASTPSALGHEFLRSRAGSVAGEAVCVVVEAVHELSRKGGSRLADRGKELIGGGSMAALAEGLALEGRLRRLAGSKLDVRGREEVAYLHQCGQIDRRSVISSQYRPQMACRAAGSGGPTGST